ncbi:MAG: glycyl-radical enzyme activating protein [Desulfobacterium sp.]
MDSLPIGTIFDIKRYAIHDGPGIRTTVFLKGCPIRCLWCANPESQAFQPELTYIKTECIGCGICQKECPNDAISLVNQEPIVDPVKCDICGRCAESCPGEALQVMGRAVTISELYKEVATDRPFWDRSGGGVTFSGGEPLAQFDFVLAFLKICKDRHVSTAIETCLHIAREKIEAVIPFVDHVICDLKIMDSKRHKAYTGVSNTLIKENIKALLKSNTDVLVRMPLIPGVNDDQGNLEAMGAFLDVCRKGTQMELLPYHRMGESKYLRMKKEYKMSHILPPSKKEMERAKGVLNRFGINVCD